MKLFAEMTLAEELQKALADLQFEKPTEIQKNVIPLAMDGRDLMACAETGSGKTAAYAIPMIARLLEDIQRRALVLAPTRELAHQIADFIRELTTHCENFQVTSLVGGADMRKQLKALKKKPRVIVATPGRLTDHLKRKSLHLNSTEILVLDEGDRMLDMGFAPQLDEILKYLPKKRQTSLFTATLPEKVQRLAGKYLFQPTKIKVGRDSLPVEAIKQSVIQLKFKEKDDRIVDELNKRPGSVIIFVRTKNRTNILTRILREYGFEVDHLHGGRTQGQRNQAIRNFKNGKTRILCATDIAARGIDVPQVEHVINFDLPVLEEDYVHRIGRTARNGAKGEAVSFVTPEEHQEWKSLAKKYKIQGVELKGNPSSSSTPSYKKKKTNRFSKAKSGGSRTEDGRSGRKKTTKKKKKKKVFGSKTEGKSPYGMPGRPSKKKKSFSKKSGSSKRKPQRASAR